MSEMKYSSDIEVNRFAEDLLLSVKQMKMKARKAERRTFVIPVVETRNKTGGAS